MKNLMKHRSRGYTIVELVGAIVGLGVVVGGIGVVGFLLYCLGKMAGVFG